MTLGSVTPFAAPPLAAVQPAVAARVRRALAWNKAAAISHSVTKPALRIGTPGGPFGSIRAVEGAVPTARFTRICVNRVT